MNYHVINDEPKGMSQQTWFNPDFKKYKANNVQAFRAMLEIVDFDGNMNKDTFDGTVKKYIINQAMTFSGVENTKSLGSKLALFYQAWKQIKRNPALKTSISTTLNAFFGSWDSNEKYTDAILNYTDTKEFPIYFNVEKYLDVILQAKDNYSGENKQLLKDYMDLSVAWRTEVESQSQASAELNGKRNNAESE